MGQERLLGTTQSSSNTSPSSQIGNGTGVGSGLGERPYSGVLHGRGNRGTESSGSPDNDRGTRGRVRKELYTDTRAQDSEVLEDGLEDVDIDINDDAPLVTIRKEAQAAQVNPEPKQSVVKKNIKKLPEQYQPTATKVANWVSGVFGDYGVNAFFGSLFTSDLAEIVGKAMPSVKRWLDLHSQRDAHINATQHYLNQNFQQPFNALKAEEQKRLNDLLQETTLEEVWVVKPAWMTDAQWDRYISTDKKTQAGKEAAEQRAEIREYLKQKYDALTPSAQKLYRDVLDWTHGTQLVKAKLMGQKIKEYEKIVNESGDADAKASAKEDLKALLEEVRSTVNMYKKPYVPLARHGSHAVVLRSSNLASLQKRQAELRKLRREQGELTDDQEQELKEVNSEILREKQDPYGYRVSFVDSQAQANALAEEWRKEAPNANIQAFPREEIAREQGVTLGATYALQEAIVKDLEASDDEQGRKLAKGMLKSLQELYLRNLSGYHVNKNQLKRMKIAGFDANMMNNFLDNANREAQFLGNVMFQGEIHDALRDVRQEALSATDREQGMRVLNELMKREHLDYTHQSSENIDKVRRVTSMMMLLTSPAFYLQNMTQSFMMSAPYMTKEFGAGDIYSLLTDNTKQIVGAFLNKNTRSGADINFDRLGFSAELKGAIDEARARGLIDIGISQDFGNLTTTSNFQRITDKMSYMARVVEMVNRVSTFKTAYELKLAKEKGKPNAEKLATDYACEVVRITHGDYSSTNEPRFFKSGGLGVGGLEKLIFQFRKFQLIQLGMIVRLFNDTFRGASAEERAVARRALLFTMGTHFVMTGLRGTPLAGLLMFMAGAMGGDGEDDEQTLRRWIGNQAAADLLIRGVPAMMGVDVSERIGAANMLSPFPYLSTSPMAGREGALETLAAIGGPAVAQLLRASSGLSYMAEGDTMKGVEMMLPNGFTNALRAYRYSTEGFSTKNGTITIPASEFSAMDTFFQALGMPTTTTTRMYNLSTWGRNATEEIALEERRLNKAYRNAKTYAERMAVQREYLELQRRAASMGLKPKAVTQLRKNAQRVEKSAREAVGGVVTNSSNRGYYEFWAKL